MKALKMMISIVVGLLLTVSSVAMGEQITVKIPTWPVTVIADAQGYAHFLGKNIRYLSKTGEPALPYHILKVLLPPDADLAQVSADLEEVAVEVEDGDWKVRLTPPVANPYVGILWPVGKKFDEEGRDIDIYSGDAPFPTGFIERVTTGQTRKWRMADIPLALYQYNPTTHKISRLVSATLVVTFKPLEQIPSILSVPGRKLEKHSGHIGEEAVFITSEESLSCRGFSITYPVHSPAAELNARAEAKRKEVIIDEDFCIPFIINRCTVQLPNCVRPNRLV